MGRHFTFPTPDRSGFEFVRVAVNLAVAYPEAETIHLVMDNLNIHRPKSVADVFGTDMAAEVWDRFTVHYTPTHGSWLNQAEIEHGYEGMRNPLHAPRSRAHQQHNRQEGQTTSHRPSEGAWVCFMGQNP